MVRQHTQSRAHSCALVGLSIAIIAVCSWVSIPIGLVSFTLQIFAVGFILLVLTPRQSVAALMCYLLLGALGAPIFSGMRGGIGVLLGPTGGYLWGFALGSFAALSLAKILKRFFENRDVHKNFAVFFADIAVVFVLIAVSYGCGLAQFMVVTDTNFCSAFMITIAPFIFFDAIKAVAAVLCARSVRQILH